MDMGLFFFLFIFFYAVTWIVFSFVYWLNAKFRGDLDYYWALDELDRVRSAMSTCRVDINSTSCPYDHFVKIGEFESTLKFHLNENIDSKTTDDVLVGLGMLRKLLPYLRDK